MIKSSNIAKFLLCNLYNPKHPSPTSPPTHPINKKVHRKFEQNLFIFPVRELRSIAFKIEHF